MNIFKSIALVATLASAMFAAPSMAESVQQAGPGKTRCGTGTNIMGQRYLQPMQSVRRADINGKFGWYWDYDMSYTATACKKSSQLQPVVRRLPSVPVRVSGKIESSFCASDGTVWMAIWYKNGSGYYPGQSWDGTGKTIPCKPS